MGTLGLRGVLVGLAILALAPPSHGQGIPPPNAELVNVAIGQLEHLGDAASQKMMSFVSAILPAVQKLAEEGRTDEASQLARRAVGVLVLMGDGSVRLINQSGERWLDFFAGRNDPVAIHLLLPAVQKVREAASRAQQEAISQLLPYLEQANLRTFRHSAAVDGS